MIRLFKCKHPFNYLGVEKEQAEKQIGADFIHVDYYLVCRKCGEKLTLKHARFVAGASAFLSRR